MLAVAAICTTLGAARFHPGAGIFVACLAILTLGRTFQVLACHLPGELDALPQKAAVLLGSLVVALIILVPSIGIGVVIGQAGVIHGRHHNVWIVWEVAGLGVLVGGVTCAVIRRRVWTYRFYGVGPDAVDEAKAAPESVAPGL